jgi:hypothetical protein
MNKYQLNLKLIIFSFCILGFCNKVKAIDLYLGPQIGISASQISIKSSTDKFTELSFIPGYQVGIISRFELPIIYIQPEMSLATSGGNYTSQLEIKKLRFANLEIPIMIGIILKDRIRIQIGPSANLLLNAKENNTSIKSNYELLNLGYQIGLGIDIGPLMLDLKYQDRLTKFGKELEGISVEHKPKAIVFSASFRLYSEKRTTKKENLNKKKHKNL